MDFKRWLREAAGELSESESPKRDAEILLEHVTGKARTYLLAFGETELTAEQEAQLAALLARRKTGEPVAHLVGEREFWSLPLYVSAATLIPRPDTECLVEQALARLPAAACSILDLGTGTGAIALALATERRDCAVTAVDVMPDAVALAQRNVERHGLRNVTVLQSSWFAALENRSFAMVVSNPPYIDEHDPHLAQGDVRFEPLTALVAGNAGLADLDHIVTTSRKHLLPGGWLLVEHGWTQGAGTVYASWLRRCRNLPRLRRQRTSDAGAVAMSLFTVLITVHLISVALTISFFIVRYWWRYSNNPLTDARWVRIAPHCIDTLLLLSGAGLMWKTGYLPFTDKGAWLTEKLFGVIIYIVLGFIALGRRRPRSQQVGFIAFLLGLVVLYIIIKLATTRIPLLG